MLVRVEGTQSGGAVYRRVVLRNTLCTAAIVVSYIITTVVVILALLRESPTSSTVRHCASACDCFRQARSILRGERNVWPVLLCVSLVAP